MLLFFFLSFIISTAQQKFNLQIEPSRSAEIIHKISTQRNFSSEQELRKELNKILLRLNEYSYLAASLDSLKKDSLSYTAYIFTGEKYSWATLRKGNVDEGILSNIGFREKVYRKKTFQPAEAARLQEKILVYCENNGYPFAQVRFDSVKMERDHISAVLDLDRGQLVKMDSLVLKGNAKISKSFLENYLGIKEGSLYNESRIQKASGRLRGLPFLQESKSLFVVFGEKGSKLYVFPERKKASQFDGIVGFLPDDKTGKILFTGDVHLKLMNAAGRGELLELVWRSLQKNTQDLNLKFVYPYLFATPLGIDYEFKLYKKDTSYLDVSNRAGIQYIFSGQNYLGAYYSSKTSDLLSVKGLETVTVLPDYADTRLKGYGMILHLENLDYRFNPRKGYTLHLNAGIGNKQVKRNAKINPDAYNGIAENMVQYNTEAEFAFFIPLAGRITIKTGSQSGYMQAPTLFANDVYRIGGLKRLRGFDEESIYASAYTVGTIEARYLLEQNSYVYVFGEGAYYENHSLNFSGDAYDTPFGFGAGISFETKAGIFSLSYALGKQFNNPIQLRSGKIHFGIVGYF